MPIVKKSKNSEDFFKPTPGMRLYALKRAKLGDDETNTEIAKQINMSRCVISQWKAIEGFNEWLEEEVEYLRQDIHEILESTAKQQIHDFRFWEAMGRKHGFIKDDSTTVTLESDKKLIIDFGDKDDLPEQS